MSLHQPKTIRAVDLAMLRDVLRIGGFRGADSIMSSDTKKAAAIYLQEVFDSGVRTKEDLVNSLATWSADRA